jgi:phosphoribosylaminoimidazole carboxylase (NCAIR synthetase)
MVNLLGQGSAGPTHLGGIDEALGVPGFSLHLYGKAECRPGRKMGHFTVTAATAADAGSRASEVETLVTITGSNQ